MRANVGNVVAALVALFSGVWSATAGAVIVNIDQFVVVRNGVNFFVDDFTDGAPPPSAPDFPIGTPRQYGVFGTFAPGIEANGVLQLGSAAGGLTQNAAGQGRRTLRATLLTNTDSQDLTTGLKIDDALTLQGIFSLTSPTGPLINGYGIRFGDRTAAPPDQLAELDVRFDSATGQVQVRYILQDFVANQITQFGLASFAPPAGADQIRLQITRPDTSNNDFFASYDYLQAGAVVGGGTFATPISLFQGENFVRAEFHAFEALPAPEPSMMWLLSGGLMALAGRRHLVRPSQRDRRSPG